jgi:hypothetical protein
MSQNRRKSRENIEIIEFADVYSFIERNGRSGKSQPPFQSPPPPMPPEACTMEFKLQVVCNEIVFVIFVSIQFNAFKVRGCHKISHLNLTRYWKHSSCNVFSWWCVWSVKFTHFRGNLPCMLVERRNTRHDEAGRRAHDFEPFKASW